MVQIAGFAKVLDDDDPPVSLSFLEVEEAYNTGWHGIAVIVLGQDDDDDDDDVSPTLAGMLSMATNFGIASGAPVGFMYALTGADPNAETGSEDDITTLEELPPGAVTRIWPSVITSVSPRLPTVEASSGSVHVSFVDPITYLGSRPIWGAYRDASLPEIVGGAISLAVGGDGKPTLNPITPDLPAVTIANDLREGLSLVPYIVAVGDTLAGWLADVQLLFSIRIEMRTNEQGGVTVTLSDKPVYFSEAVAPSGFLPIDGITNNTAIPLSFSSQSNDDDDDDDDDENSGTQLDAQALKYAQLDSFINNATYTSRGIVLDDPLAGVHRRIGSLGAVGTIISGSGVSIDEAVTRATGPLYGRFLSALVAEVNTKQPGVRPGRVVNFGASFFGVDYWQINKCSHLLDGTNYVNRITIIDSEHAWRPREAFARRAPVYVTAIVDGGSDFDEMDPVPRDRLGRIPVTLSFLPKPIGEEAKLLEHSDSDEDGRIELEDFDDADDFEEREDYWEALITEHQAGGLVDPYEGQPDDELTEEQRGEREAFQEKERGVYRYMAYQREKTKDKLDRDQDGAVSSRDAAISPQLASLLASPGAVMRIQRQIAARESDDETALDEIDHEDRIPEELLDEYKAFFQRYDGEGDDPTRAHKISAIKAKNWPPRIPVTAIEAMAGGLHGLISAHRQGDICRIAVHSPISIELVGYQYRSDRQINNSLVSATTGMVVDHNQGEAWSGFVFRPSVSLDGGADSEEDSQEDS